MFLLSLLSLLSFKALCDSIQSGYVHALPDSFLCQHEKLSSVAWTAMTQKWRKSFTYIKHCGGPARGGSHVTRLNFKMSRVGVYNCLSLIVDCRLCHHCHNLAEGGCLLSRFHFMRCRYFLGHVACRNLPWQGLIVPEGLAKRVC